jgi:hypothetical protein
LNVSAEREVEPLGLGFKLRTDKDHERCIGNRLEDRQNCGRALWSGKAVTDKSKRDPRELSGFWGYEPRKARVDLAGRWGVFNAGGEAVGYLAI